MIWANRWVDANANRVCHARRQQRSRYESFAVDVTRINPCPDAATCKGSCADAEWTDERPGIPRQPRDRIAWGGQNHSTQRNRNALRSSKGLLYGCVDTAGAVARYGWWHDYKTPLRRVFEVRPKR